MVGLGPITVAITPDGRTLYVSNYQGDTVTPIQADTGMPLNPVKVGVQPDDLAVTPDGRAVYVVNYSSDDSPGYVTPIRTCAAYES